MEQELLDRLLAESGLDNFISGKNKFLSRFVELVVDECIDAVIECDKSPKMIVHEPYRTIIDAIQQRIEGE